MKNKATEVFNDWAQNGKDEGMKNNHFSSFTHIKEIIQSNLSKKEGLEIADIGCGNGWATDDLLKEEYISKATGFDGAKKMIEKANATFSGPTFVESNLNNWKPSQSFDLIYSMEVLYYLNNPNNFVKQCSLKWLRPGGLFIAGIDHYKENEPSLSWEEDLKVKMQTKTKNEWKEILIEHDLKDCNVMQVNESEDWAGTLIFWGFKNAL